MSVRHSDDDVATDPDASGSRRRRKRRSWARRRHLGLITTGVALLVLVVGLVVVVLTWDNGRTPLSQRVSSVPTSAAPELTPTGSAAATPTSAPGPISVRATITAVGDSQWTADGRTGITYTVLITPDTQFPGKRTFDTYAVGDSVAIQGTLDAGVITATVIGANR